MLMSSRSALYANAASFSVLPNRLVVPFLSSQHGSDGEMGK